ncbi:MAG: 4Fe-4S binding protein [Desulfobacterales bacterium]|nr:4Fe-4S binding protein [Desulfobacterales bacterium]
MVKPQRAICTECEICMQVCTWHHFQVAGTKRSRIRISAQWPDIPSIRVCLACRKKECITACPTDALSFDGWIRLDEEKCDGCAVCAGVCPVDGINFDPETGNPLICDTCQGAYQCVQCCPVNALKKKEG